MSDSELEYENEFPEEDSNYNTIVKTILTASKQLEDIAKNLDKKLYDILKLEVEKKIISEISKKEKKKKTVKKDQELNIENITYNLSKNKDIDFKQIGKLTPASIKNLISSMFFVDTYNNWKSFEFVNKDNEFTHDNFLNFSEHDLQALAPNGLPWKINNPRCLSIILKNLGLSNEKIIINGVEYDIEKTTSEILTDLYLIKDKPNSSYCRIHKDVFDSFKKYIDIEYIEVVNDFYIINIFGFIKKLNSYLLQKKKKRIFHKLSGKELDVILNYTNVSDVLNLRRGDDAYIYPTQLNKIVENMCEKEFENDEKTDIIENIGLVFFEKTNKINPKTFKSQILKD